MGNLRSPLGQVRGLGSAKSGTHHFWVQRLSALALVPLAVWFLASLVAMTGSSYEAFVAWLQQPWVTILMLLFVLTGIYHFRLGVQVVIEDYIHREITKVSLLALMTMACAVAAVAATFAILRIALA